MWRGVDILFRDMLFLLVFAYLIISAVALAHVAKKEQQASQNDTAAPGHVVIELTWARDSDADVDLWVQAPGDIPVGYSNKSGVIFNLLRDDMGRSGDPNSMNYEVAYGRSPSPAHYLINAILYPSHDKKLPLAATVKVALRADTGVQQILQSTADLTYEGQETTVFRFKLDDHGDFLPDSVNRLHKPLRAATRPKP